MRGSTHLAAGATIGLAAAQVTSPGDWRALAAGTALGGLAGLLPDWLQVNVPGGSRLVRGAFGHRGLTHWLLSAGLAGYAAWLLWQPAFLSVALGWASHVLLDALSGGAPAFFPLPRLTLARVKTGSWMDYLFGGAGLALLVAQAVAIILSWRA
jgi:membrane-bound metal-dependent hydrolase YbcI (DUF457 family)